MNEPNERQNKSGWWGLLIFSLWWNGIGGMILAVMAFLSAIGVMKPFGIYDFEHDMQTHISIIVLGLYLVAMFVVYLKYKNEFDNNPIVRYRILSLFLASGWIAVAVFGSAMENAISLL